LLIPFSLASKKYRYVAVALIGSFTYTVLFVLSKQTPALSIIGRIPFADTFRWHERMIDLNQFMIAALVGLGLSFIYEKGD